ncbi:hypothetical protein [Nocardia sp. IFM 10818]
MTATAEYALHVPTAVLCAGVAATRIPRWKYHSTRPTTVMLAALAALNATVPFSLMRHHLAGTGWDTALSYLFAVLASAAMIYLAARALTYTRKLWLTHMAAVVCGGFIGAYISVALHYEGAVQEQFLLVITACITTTSGAFLFASTLPAIAERDIPLYARLTLVLLAAASLLWASGGAVRFAENVPFHNAALSLLQHLPTETPATGAILFAVAGILSLNVNWRDEAPLEPEPDDSGSSAVDHLAEQ